MPNRFEAAADALLREHRRRIALQKMRLYRHMQITLGICIECIVVWQYAPMFSLRSETPQGALMSDSWITGPGYHRPREERGPLITPMSTGSGRVAPRIVPLSEVRTSANADTPAIWERIAEGDRVVFPYSFNRRRLR